LLGTTQERRRASAVFLDTLQPVTLIFADPATEPNRVQSFELAEALAVPGVAPVLERGVDGQGRPFIAVARPGQRLVDRRRGVDRDTLLAACGEAARLLATLAALGVKLPDVHPARFELDDRGRLWLTDVSDAVRAPSADASAAHAQLIARFCRELAQSSRQLVLRPGLLRELDAATSAIDAARLFARAPL
jgi:hypothetical protein